MPLEQEAERAGGRLPGRDRRRDQARGDRGQPARRPRTRRARRAGMVDARVVRSSTSSSAASPTACTGTCRTSTTCGSRPRPSRSSATSCPALRGEGGDAYAVTEAEAGSDPGGIATTAVADRRRLADQRREVVRHLGRRRPRADRDGQRRRRRRPAADAVPRRARRARASSSSTTRRSPTTTRTATRRSASPTSRSAADAVIGGVGKGEDAAAALVHRGAPGDRHPRPRRDVAAARRDDRLGADARAGRAADHGLPGDLVPAGRLGDRCRRSAGCSRSQVCEHGRRAAPTRS